MSASGVTENENLPFASVTVVVMEPLAGLLSVSSTIVQPGRSGSPLSLIPSPSESLNFTPLISPAMIDSGASWIDVPSDVVCREPPVQAEAPLVGPSPWSGTSPGFAT